MTFLFPFTNKLWGRVRISQGGKKVNRGLQDQYQRLGFSASRCADRYLMTCSKDAQGFPGGSVLKNPPADAGDVGSIPGLGRSPGEGNGNPLQDSCPGNPMDREAWQPTVSAWSQKSQTPVSD